MAKKKLVPKTVNPKDVKFAYFSVCHNAAANKSPLTMPQGRGIGVFGAKPETDTQGLGGWRCSTCLKSCKVTRAAKSTLVPVEKDQEEKR